MHTLCTEASSIPLAKTIPLMAWWGLYVTGKRAEGKRSGVGGCHIHVGDVVPDVTSLHARTRSESCSCLLKAAEVRLWGHCQQWKTEPGPRSSPTQINMNFAGLFSPRVSFHSKSWEWLRVCLRKKSIQLLFFNSCWGRGSIMSHWGFLCLFCPFRTALTTVHIYFLFFLFPSISSAVPVYHLWVFCLFVFLFFLLPQYRNK